MIRTGVAVAVLAAALSGWAVPSAVLVPDRSDSSRWRLRIRLSNDSAGAVSFKVRAEGRPEHSQPGGVDTVAELTAGAVREIAVSGPIIGNELVALTVDVRNALTGQVFLEKKLDWRPNGEPAQAALDRGVRFRFAYYPSYGRIRLVADVTKADPRPTSFAATLLDARGTELAKTGLVVAGDRAEKIWEVPDLRAATKRSGSPDYRLVLADAATGTCETQRFERCVLDWEGYRGGLSDRVPAPFGKVKVETRGADERVSVILRDHLVDRKTGLWKQVTAAGRDVLARPMRLVSSSGATFAARTAWDFDGMMTWTLTLPPGHCEPLRLEIPFKAGRARLMHVCTDGLRKNYAGVVPAGEGRVWDSSQAWRGQIRGNYVPYVWVGGPLRGISVFCENDRGWVTDEARVKSQEIFREADGTVRLVFNLVQRPYDLTEARTIRLGFLATPVKPMEDGWRAIPIGTLLGSCKYWGAYTGCDDVHPYDGTDDFFRRMGEAARTGTYDPSYARACAEARAAYLPADAPARAKVCESSYVHMLAGLREAAARKANPAHKLVFYTNGRGVRLGTQTGRTFCDEWTREEFAGRPYVWGSSLSYSLDPNSSYRDFAAYWWEKMLSTGACDYLYWDDVFLAANLDLVGTDAYVRDDGRIEPATGIFNMREQVRRAAVLQTELGLVPRRNWIHMTNTALAPICSFAGVNYDWEDFQGDKPLHERYSRERIQAETIGRQFGNKVAVMGYFATTDPKSEKLKWLERTGTGLCLTHELLWTRVKVWNDAYGRLRDWGYCRPETTVWNYWDEDVPFPARIDGGKSAALAMSRDGDAILVVSDCEKGGAYRIVPDLKALGVRGPFRAIDLETGKSVPIEDGVLQVALSRFDYAMIRLSSAEHL